MKTTFKDYYKATSKPEYINPEKGIYISVEGVGGPNGDEFKTSIELLYKLSYKLRMSYKNTPPEGWEKYVVAPLEGIWTTNDNKPFDNLSKDKLNFKLMIRQPNFFTKKIFTEYIKELKIDNPNFSKVKYEMFNEGKCIQIMHIGPYETEPESQAKLFDLLKEDGLGYIPESHHEIYLSDFRKTDPSKLKTILRYKVVK